MSGISTTFGHFSAPDVCLGRCVSPGSDRFLFASGEGILHALLDEKLKRVENFQADVLPSSRRAPLIVHPEN
jgi:hypothetical protein